MIIDKIENSGLYLALHHRFEKAFEFLRKTDFSTLEPGKYELDGEDLFAISTLLEQTPIQEYDPIDDFHLFLDETYEIHLKKQMFAIMFPDDLHLPGLRSKKTQEVIKVVIKVKI